MSVQAIVSLTSGTNTDSQVKHASAGVPKSKVSSVATEALSVNGAAAAGGTQTSGSKISAKPLVPPKALNVDEDPEWNGETQFIFTDPTDNESEMKDAAVSIESVYRDSTRSRKVLDNISHTVGENQKHIENPSFIGFWNVKYPDASLDSLLMTVGKYRETLAGIEKQLDSFGPQIASIKKVDTINKNQMLEFQRDIKEISSSFKDINDSTENLSHWNSTIEFTINEWKEIEAQKHREIFAKKKSALNKKHDTFKTGSLSFKPEGMAEAIKKEFNADITKMNASIKSSMTLSIGYIGKIKMLDDELIVKSNEDPIPEFYLDLSRYLKELVEKTSAIKELQQSCAKLEQMPINIEYIPSLQKIEEQFRSFTVDIGDKLTQIDLKFSRKEQKLKQTSHSIHNLAKICMMAYRVKKDELEAIKVKLDKGFGILGERPTKLLQQLMKVHARVSSKLQQVETAYKETIEKHEFIQKLNFEGNHRLMHIRHVTRFVQKMQQDLALIKSYNSESIKRAFLSLKEAMAALEQLSSIQPQAVVSDGKSEQ